MSVYISENPETVNFTDIGYLNISYVLDLFAGKHMNSLQSIDMRFILDSCNL